MKAANLNYRFPKKSIEFWTGEIISGNIEVKELEKFLLSNHKFVAFNAFWIVSFLASKHPKTLVGHEKMIFNALIKRKDNETAVRCSLSAFRILAIPEYIEDELYNFCFSLLNSPKTPIAHRSFASVICAKIARKHAGLRDELIAIIKINEELYGSYSPAVKSSSRQALKLLTLR